MGASHGLPAEHVTKSKADFRRELKRFFQPALATWQTQNESANQDTESQRQECRSKEKLVFAVRTRPLFTAEEERGDFEGLTVQTGLEGHGVWAHLCELRMDFKHMYVEQEFFPFDVAFGKAHSAEEVFHSCIRPALHAAAKRVGVLAFGQTGSGKTFSMRGVCELLAAQIDFDKSQIMASALDVHGEQVRDAKTGKKVELLEDADGALVTKLEESPGATADLFSPVDNVEALLSYLNAAFDSRRSAATAVHDASSRTHLVLRIRTESQEVCLVDLAGSEWARDQRAHSRERTAEAKEINRSLMALKRCLRGRAQWQRGLSDAAPRLPVRDSKLTRLLAPFFLDVDSSSAVVLATVSPGAAQIEHAIDTLQHCCLQPSPGACRPTSTILIPDLAPRPGPSTPQAAASERGSEGSLARLSSAEVCEWWTRAAQAAVSAHQAAWSSGSDAAESTFELRVSAAAYAKMRLTGRVLLGLVFEKASAAAADRCPGPGLTVRKVSASGVVPASPAGRALMRQGRLKAGVRLLRPEGAAALQEALAAFRDAVAAWQAWDAAGEGAEGCMSAEMRALRAYVMGAEEEQAEAPPASPSVAAPAPPPPDCLLALRFADAAGPAQAAGLRPPPVPRAFTGHSRTGEVWGGRELVDKFGSEVEGRARFEKACGDPRLAEAMWQQLRNDNHAIAQVAETHLMRDVDRSVEQSDS